MISHTYFPPSWSDLRTPNSVTGVYFFASWSCTHLIKYTQSYSGVEWSRDKVRESTSQHLRSCCLQFSAPLIQSSHLLGGPTLEPADRVPWLTFIVHAYRTSLLHSISCTHPQAWPDVGESIQRFSQWRALGGETCHYWLAGSTFMSVHLPLQQMHLPIPLCMATVVAHRKIR